MHTHSGNSLTPFLSQTHINILFYRKPRDFTNLRKLRRRHVPRDHYPRRISSQSKENNFYPVTSIEDFPSSRPRGKTLPLFLSQTREVSSMVTATKNRTNHFATYVSGSRSFVLTDTFPPWQTRVATPDTTVPSILPENGGVAAVDEGTRWLATRNRSVRLLTI